MNTLIFDLETQKLAEEVGGWKNVHKLMLSIGVIYDCSSDRYETYDEAAAGELIRRLRGADRVVGFNVVRFDYTVLSAYDPKPIETPTVDMLQVIQETHGHRVSLQSLAQGTLGDGQGKIASGLDAVRWWRSGEIDKIIEYCREDVRVTRDVYRFGAEKGYLLSIPPWGGSPQRLSVAWPGEREP